MIMDVYFAQRFAKAVGIIGFIFAGVVVLLDLVEQIRRFDVDTVNFGQIVRMSLLSVPETLYAILPLIMVLASVMLFLSLARTSELVVARATGRSALRSLIAPLVVAGIVGILAVSILNPIVAATSQRYDLNSDRLLGNTANTLSIGPQGVWLRQGDLSGQTVIRADRADLSGTELIGVTFLGYRPDGGPAFRIEAEEARLFPGQWVLTNAKEWQFSNPNPEQTASQHETLTLASTISATEILDSFADPSAVPIWDLPAFIGQMEGAGFSARKHEVWLQMELALPLLLAAMVLVGAGFTMRHIRFGSTGLMIGMALALGFTLFFIRNFAQILAENGQIPVLLAAWGPPVAAVLLPLGLLLHWEDG